MEISIDTKSVLGPIGLEVRNELEQYYLELTTDRKGGPLHTAAKAISESKMDFGTLIQLTQLPLTTSVAIGCAYTGLADKLGKNICTYYNFKMQDTHRVRLGAFIIDAFVRKGLVLPKLVNFKTNNKGQKTVWMVYARDRGKLEKLRKEFPKVDESSYTLNNQAQAEGSC